MGNNLTRFWQVPAMGAAALLAASCSMPSMEKDQTERPVEMSETQKAEIAALEATLSEENKKLGELLATIDQEKLEKLTGRKLQDVINHPSEINKASNLSGMALEFNNMLYQHIGLLETPFMQQLREQMYRPLDAKRALEKALRNQRYTRTIPQPSYATFISNNTEGNPVAP